MASRHVNHSFRRHDAFSRNFKRPSTRRLCQVCGQVCDVFHNDKACGEAWMKKIESQDTPKGRTP